MDIVWGVFGYSANSKIVAKYPHEVEIVRKFLENRDVSDKFKPGCGGAHKMDDRRVKKFIKKAHIISSIRNSVETNKFSVDIERELIEKANIREDLNSTRQIQIEVENTRITVIINSLV
jgi:hypothetical protein